ncbi:polysaccharide pyruvyl transferase family protein [Micromonospora vulcania]
MTHDAGLTIGVLGSYGGRNLGDEAILTGLLTDLRTQEPNARIIVFSRHPEHTRLAHPDVEAVPWEGVSRTESALVLAQLDLLILGGGGILYDREARRYLRVVRVAQERGLPLITYAVGVGPLSDAVDTGMVRETLSGATQLTVRDQESRMVLEEAGLLNPITVTADPAFLLKPADFPPTCWPRRGAGRPTVGRDQRAGAGPGRRAARRGRLPPPAGPDRGLPGAPDRRVRAVRADGTRRHPACPRGVVPHGGRRSGADPARHLLAGAGARADAPLRPGRRHAPALPDLRGDGRHTVPAPAVRRQGLRPGPAARGAGAARRGAEVEGPLLAEVDRLWDEREQRAEATARRVAEVCEQARGTSEVTRGVLDSLRNKTLTRA